MTDSKRTRHRWFKSVLHPTDFSAASDTAFAHALAISVVGRARFTIMHVGGEYAADDAWHQFPRVRETLVRWGLLEAGSPPDAIFERLGTRIRKIVASGEHPLDPILDYLDTHDVDLIVLATEGRHGLPRWLRPSVAESLARESAIATLFVPQGIEGFVPVDDAAIRLGRILIPIDATPDATSAIRLAQRLGTVLGEDSDICLLHAGDHESTKRRCNEVAERAGVRLETRRGDVVDEITRFARKHAVDLIVMPTAGHDGVLDALRGSTSEQVLRRASCAVLAVPAE